jgi:diaminohydroxyphosphoribosylaminopyrimidine deaminase/5-amino-6-(5-phosphoribosylamino)uracil reductase
MYSVADHEFMSQALRLAHASLYLSNPNPRVGCVLVKDGQVIGSGHTQAVGSSHAEVMALLDAKNKGFSAAGATAYVTLEPCCHHGRTPPCTDSLIAAGISTVIAAMEDPNPLVAGQGLQALRAAGLTVRCGLLEKEATELNIGFVKRMRTGMPFVRMKIASSLDGRTALNNGTSQWITSSAARTDGHAWRARACCVLTGIGTVKEDDPQLTVRDIDTVRQPLRVLIDSYLEVQANAKILNTELAPTLIICGQASTARIDELSQALADRNIQIVSLADTNGKVNLRAALRYLAEKCHINEVHVEAGFKLNGSLIQSACVDELLIYMAPNLLGSGMGLARLPELTDLSALPDTLQWQYHDYQMLGTDLRLRLRPPMKST